MLSAQAKEGQTIRDRVPLRRTYIAVFENVRRVERVEEVRVGGSSRQGFGEFESEAVEGVQWV